LYNGFDDIDADKSNRDVIAFEECMMLFIFQIVLTQLISDFK
jgi:hypothetical protein